MHSCDFPSENLCLALFPSFVGETQIFSDGVFEPHVRGGRLLEREWEVSLPNNERMPLIRHVLLALLDEAWRLDDAYDILNHHEGDRRRHSDDGHVCMGRLLGYTEEEFGTFIDLCERMFRKWGDRERRWRTAA